RKKAAAELTCPDGKPKLAPGRERTARIPDEPGKAQNLGAPPCSTAVGPRGWTESHTRESRSRGRGSAMPVLSALVRIRARRNAATTPKLGRRRRPKPKISISTA